MNCLDKKHREWTGICGTVLLSITVSLFIGKGNLHFGLFSDNQTQWLPVIDKAYQVLFQTGRLPTIDFFQMQGMEIYSQGYYGLWNPFMLAAYVLKTYVFTSFHTNTITVYILIMIILGNICCYKIFRELKTPVCSAVIFSVVLMSVSIYTVLRYWYYIYNVYFILTFLILSLIKDQEKKSYYIQGAILSLSLFMGNIQYTAYLYMVYGIFMAVLFFRGRKDVLIKFISNSVCMAFFSIVHLLLLFQASSGSIAFSENSDLYYSSSLHPVIMAFFSWIPAAFGENVWRIVENILYSKIPVPDTTEFPGIYGFYMGTVVCAAVVFIVQKRNYKKDRLYEIASACLIAAGILMLISFGKVGVLSIFFEQIPFLNKFRILAKYLVLLPPLLLPCTAVVLREQRKARNKYAIAFIVFLLFGLIQNRQLTFDIVPAQPAKSINRFEELGVDYHNYRIASFVSSSQIFFIYPQWEEYSKKEIISLEEKFSNNTGTSVDVMTLGGYDTVFDYGQYQLSDGIMSSVYGLSDMEFSCQNMVIEENFFSEKYNRENVDYWDNIKELKRQFIDNGVKYFVFSKDSVCLTSFLQTLEDMSLEIEWQYPFMDHTIILSVKDIDSVVKTAEGDKIDALVTMDQICFYMEENQECHIAMYYDKNLRAVYTGRDGEKTNLDIFPDKEGHIIVSGKAEGQGKIEIYYHNNWYIFTQIWESIILFLMAIMLFAPEIGWIRNICCFMEKRMEAALCYLGKVCPEKGSRICFCIFSGLYVLFLVYYYFHVQCTVPDEDWFLQMMKTIHHKAGNDIFVYLSETENYLGYGQIYWILGSIFSNIFFLRAAAFLMLIGSGLLTLWEVKSHFGVRMVPYAGLLWISMPFAWYSDKIIGPELMGFFLGILGSRILSSGKNKSLGWGLLGVSCAVKIYYGVFALAMLLLEMPKEQKNKIGLLIKAGMAGLCGFVIANPMILWNFPEFLNNLYTGNRTQLNQMAYIFERREYEWDGVMVNGVFWGYASAFFLLVLILRLLVYRKHNRYLANVMITVSFLLILMCCREFFLGWYLLPLCYFIVITASCLFDFRDMEQGDRNLNQWLFIVCLVINAAILLPEHISNRGNDVEYVRTLADKEKIKETAQSAEERIQKSYPDRVWYNLLDFHMDEYSYNFTDYVDFCINDAEGIAIIGDRMRIVDSIDEMIQKAVVEEEGLHILYQTKGLWIVERNGK